MPQILPVDGFEWVKNNYLYKKYSKDSDLRYFFAVHVEYLCKLYEITMTYSFIRGNEN